MKRPALFRLFVTAATFAAAAFSIHAQTPPPAPAAPAAGAPGQAPPPAGRGGGRGTIDLGPQGPVLPVSPTEQVKRFWLPSGYTIDPVLSEPRLMQYEVVEDKGVKILIDPKAVLFLLGTEMDYKAEKLSAQFVFNNPNQTSACGCGESVQLKPATDTAQ